MKTIPLILICFYSLFTYANDFDGSKICDTNSWNRKLSDGQPDYPICELSIDKNKVGDIQIELTTDFKAETCYVRKTGEATLNLIQLKLEYTGPGIVSINLAESNSVFASSQFRVGSLNSFEQNTAEDRSVSIMGRTLKGNNVEVNCYNF